MLVPFFPFQFSTNATQHLQITSSIEFLKHLMVEILSMKDIHKIQISRENTFLRGFQIICVSLLRVKEHVLVK